jgi:nicotinamide mononucleotide transporter
LLGLITSVLYIYVFFEAKFYADMALQGYYVFISVYGWILWTKGKTANDAKASLKVSQVSAGMIYLLSTLSIIIFGVIWVILKYFTDSPVPIGDAFTTALSIVATWMLAKKIIEHWLIWIVVDFVSLGLYLYKGLYATSLLFLVYSLAAIWGYFVWKKDLNRQAHGRATV